VGLVAALSNRETAAVFQRLAERDWRPVRRSAARPRDRTRDGKLKYGTVLDAVLAVMAEADRPLRYIEIHARVEMLMGMSVPKTSVKHLLHMEKRRKTHRIVRVGDGVYCLAQEAG
jgi:hypothetical protein